MINRIVITGPESSGKTTLANYLSANYNVPLVEEYARYYLENLSKPYTFDDVILMAEEQLRHELNCNNNLCVCDTDLTVFYVWIKEKYKKEVAWINQHLAAAQNKIYLLCDVLENWEEDPLREHPNIEDRKRLFNEYIKLLEFFNLKFHIISGDLKTRQKKCEEIISSLLEMRNE